MSDAKHTPGLMRVLSAVEVSANAARIWREAYRDWEDEDTYADGTTKGAHNDALNRTAHTPEAIAEILGPTWARPQCGSCNAYVDFVVQMIDPWADDSSRALFSLCGNCVAHAAAIAKAAAKRATA